MDVAEATLVMLSVIKNGGLAPGGFNFDAKLYQSFDSELGAAIEAGKADLELLEKKAFEWGEMKMMKVWMNESIENAIMQMNF
nr:xylose isomerase [Ipomoea batatas]